MQIKPQIRGLQFIINMTHSAAYSITELALLTIEGGVDSIQLRCKEIYTREMFCQAEQLAEICQRFSVPLIVNDRLDIALAIQASGVHLGQTDMPIEVVRRLIGKNKIIGATASTLEQAKKAELEGADYIGFGHIFPTTSKIKNDPPVGLNTLMKVCEQICIPILAIGGINEANLRETCATGVSGVAVVSAICFSSSPRNQTQKLKNIMRIYET